MVRKIRVRRPRRSVRSPFRFLLVRTLKKGTEGFELFPYLEEEVLEADGDKRHLVPLCFSGQKMADDGALQWMLKCGLVPVTLVEAMAFVRRYGQMERFAGRLFVALGTHQLDTSRFRPQLHVGFVINRGELPFVTMEPVSTEVDYEGDLPPQDDRIYLAKVVTA